MPWIQVSENDKTFATELMASVGKVFWLTNEAAINDIIAVTGSAPAYFLLFMELMQQEAERLGFDSKTARELVLYTAQGSAALAAKQIRSLFCDTKRTSDFERRHYG